jgi:hypothetical protein
MVMTCGTGCSEAAKLPEKSAIGPEISFAQKDDKVDVLIGGKLFTSYMFSNTLTKPVLYPVKTPAGIKVNRGYPFETVEGEATDHPHHVGIFFTYDMVNDEGFWNNTTYPPQVKHVKISSVKNGQGKGELSTVMHWVGKSGDALLEENRRMVFTAGGGQYAINFSIDLTAQDKKVVFGDTKEGMFAIRTAQWLREKDGTGKYFSSNGDASAESIWGKRARWVVLEGHHDSDKAGIAIFNYPGTVNYPTYWHARDYGLFAANPLGQLAFQKTRKEPDAKALSLTLQPGETAHFEFAIVIYDGSRTPEQIEALYGGLSK